MSLRLNAVFAAAFLLSAPATSQAVLSGYTQNFESLVQADPAALANDGWVVYGNVFTPAMVYVYGYGPFPAPNPGGGFSAIEAGQGGAGQGVQQLSVYSDYNNLDHANGRLIESNVFHEQTIAAGDIGTRWTFQFDAKLGNLVSPSTAQAFIKTLDPDSGYATTNFFTADMTTIPATWATYSISIDVVAGLTGQLMQFGFTNLATNYVSSGVLYDNLSWQLTGTLDAPGTPRPAALELRSPAPNPSVSATRLDYSLAQQSMVDISIYDVTGRRVTTLVHGEIGPGLHAIRWDGRDAAGRLAPPGVYRCVLRTDDGHRTRSLVLSR